MARKKTDTGGLTPLELEIMNVLWAHGPASVQAVQEELREQRDLAYTSVQTMLNVLVKKGHAARDLRDRAFVYAAATSKASAMSEAVTDLLNKMFGGSAEGLVLNLLETKKITPAKIARLQALAANKGGAK